MLTNFLAWGEKRIKEIPNDAKVEPGNKAIEISKLKDRLGKFKDKMVFMKECENQLSNARQNKKLLNKGKRTAMEIQK